MTAPAKPDMTANDRAAGYHYALDSGEYSVEWLASEIRLKCGQIAKLKQDYRDLEAREARREANLRHILAHDIAARMFAWKLGKHATAGAFRALDAVYPVSRCDTTCPERRT